MLNKEKSLEEMNKEELAEHSKFINSTIESLHFDLKSGSKVKSNQAHMRLDFWEKKRFELDNYLYRTQETDQA